MPDLSAWLAFAPQLDAIYQQELGRSCYSDPQAFVNWAYHGLQEGQSLDWIRDRIRESDEWQQKHGSNGPLPVPAPAPPPLPGSVFASGLVEYSTSQVVRPGIPSNLRLPASRGPFQFPSPYGTRGIRVTDSSDGTIRPVGYSYWPNASAVGDKVLVFCGSTENQLLRFEVERSSGRVEPLGPARLPWPVTAEGFYFTPYWPTKIMAPMGKTLWRIDFYTGAMETVLTSDYNLWQVSTSDDGQVHAGTVRDAGYNDVGYFTAREGQVEVFSLPTEYDECQLDKSGQWLVVKCGGDNVVRKVRTPVVSYVIPNAAGAVGHSDTGTEVVIGEDDMHEPGALVRFILGGPSERQLLYHLTQWDTGLGHVAVRNDRILVSHSHTLQAPRVNELVLVDPSGSGRVRIVCPNLNDMGAGSASAYEKQVKANIDPSGQFACWSANPGSGVDIFLVELP